MGALLIGATRAAAVVLAGLVAAYALRTGEAPPALAAIAAVAVLLVVAGATAAPEWTLWTGVFLLGSAYVADLTMRDAGVDPLAPAVAASLYLIVETREVVSSGREHAPRRAWHSVGVAFAAALLVSVLLAAGTVVRASGPVAVAASALCGALLLSGFALLAGSRAGERDG